MTSNLARNYRRIQHVHAGLAAEASLQRLFVEHGVHLPQCIAPDDTPGTHPSPGTHSTVVRLPNSAAGHVGKTSLRPSSTHTHGPDTTSTLPQKRTLPPAVNFTCSTFQPNTPAQDYRRAPQDQCARSHIQVHAPTQPRIRKHARPLEARNTCRKAGVRRAPNHPSHSLLKQPLQPKTSALKLGATLLSPVSLARTSRKIPRCSPAGVLPWSPVCRLTASRPRVASTSDARSCHPGAIANDNPFANIVYTVHNHELSNTSDSTPHSLPTTLNGQLHGQFPTTRNASGPIPRPLHSQPPVHQLPRSPLLHRALRAQKIIGYLPR